jgi:hypothetical protein
VALIQNIHIGLTGWVGLFAYVVGNRVVNSGNAYQCITAGTSAAGAGPTTTGSNITDGTVHWKWLSAADFTSLASAQASLPSTFTQPITWRFWNDGTITIPGATTAYLLLAGHTTTSTNNLTLTCAPGESFRDTLAASGSTALAFNAAAGVSFTLPTTTPGVPFNYFDITDANVVFDGLQFKDPNSASGCTIIQSQTGATGFALRNCIVDGYAQANGASINYLTDAFVVENCLVVDRQPVGGGQVATSAKTTGTVVNSTLIATNNPAATVAIVSNGTTSSGIIIRNVACFGYPAGIGQSSVSGANVVIDHCATDATQIYPGYGATDGGGNLLSQSASTNFVSTTTDFRLKLGASCVNAGVTDTTDIPLATDIVGVSRPQGSAWDIGAFELNSLMMRGVGAGRGKSGLAQSAPARGISKANGRGLLVLPATLNGTGIAVSRGKSSGTFTQSLAAGSKASGTGRSSPTVALPGNSKGTSRASGGILITPIALGVERGTSRASGRNAISAAKAVAGSALARSTGQSALLSALPLPARGLTKSSGRGSLVYVARTSALGKASGRGVGAISGPAVLRATGLSLGSSRPNVIYTAPSPLSGGLCRGRASASGLAAISTVSALSAAGKSTARGAIVYGSNIAILIARGGAQSFCRSAAMAEVTALAAASRASGFGRGNISGAKSLIATGIAIARGVARAALPVFMPSRGRSSATGSGPAVIAATLSAAGVSRSVGKVRVNYDARLHGVSQSLTAGRFAISVSQPLNAAGLTQGIGQLGGTGTQRLTSTSGSARAIGIATPTLKVLLAGYGLAKTTGRCLPLVGQGLRAGGTSSGNGLITVAAVNNLVARGSGAVWASLNVAGAATLALTGSGRTTSSGKTTIVLAAALSGAGRAVGLGRLSAFTGATALIASGRSIATAKATNLGFAPIAMTASGRARSLGYARPTATTGLQGTGVGLSVGRCAAIASALMMASGRSRAAGQLSAAVAIGFRASGTAEARGRLFASNAVSARGGAGGFGSGRLAGYYNVTPDMSGPRLSTIGQLPFFDSMDIGDVDFFSFDWSNRASLLGDPIVSASVTASPSGMPIGPLVIVGDIVQVRAGATALIETFSLRCSVTLRSGRTLHWSAPVSVEDF